MSLYPAILIFPIGVLTWIGFQFSGWAAGKIHSSFWLATLLHLSGIFLTGGLAIGGAIAVSRSSDFSIHYGFALLLFSMLFAKGIQYLVQRLRNDSN